MRLLETPLAGLLVVEQERIEDERGFFARTYDVAEMVAIVQMSTSFNAVAGTLRGLHHQADPHAESKLVRCTRGALFDVAVDLRPRSPTRGQWYGVQLDAQSGRALLIGPGFAHGFQTLADDTEVLYAIDTAYVPGAACGVRWDDPAFAIAWPEPAVGHERTISERDRTYADWAG
jgi:dTDP-4-dehydrorhamnose 3,5-epimerase